MKPLKAIICISGYTEKGYESTGSRDLWWKLYDEFSNSECLVLYHEWNDDLKGRAKMLNDLGVSEVLVCSYSWGSGNGLKKFSKAFDGTVKAVLCDPVYRSFLRSFRWVALTFDWTIKFPDNVKVVRWFKQTINEPGNDNVTAGAILCDPVILPYNHSQIDNSPEYHHAAMQEARFYTAE